MLPPVITTPSQTLSGSSYTDREILQIAAGSPIHIAQWIKDIAAQRGIVFRQRSTDPFAKAVSRLSDAAFELDPVEELLIALRREGMLTPFQRSLLQARYLR